VSLPEETRRATLARFEGYRAAYARNAPLRDLYARWYGRVAAELPPPSLGPRVEVGSGPGFSRGFIADLELTDLVRAPWHDREMDALAMPYPDASLGALVLFDVLHHLPEIARFFSEAQRVLRPGGRVVLCEPYASPLSYPVYRYLHPEGLDAGVDPWHVSMARDKDPFESNQAVPTLAFARESGFARRFPQLRVVRRELLAGPSYVATGGLGRSPVLPRPLWDALVRLEDLLPAAAFRWIGFRILVTVERV